MTETAEAPETLTPPTAIPAPEVREETWRREDGMLLRRLSRMLAERRIGTMFLCIDCFQANRESNIVAQKDEHSGEVHLHCLCKDRRLEGVRG